MGDLAELKCDRAVVGIDEHEAVHVAERGSNLEAPDQPWPQRIGSSDQRRVVDPQLGLGDHKVCSSDLFVAGDERSGCFGSLGARDGGDDIEFKIGCDLSACRDNCTVGINLDSDLAGDHRYAGERLLITNGVTRASRERPHLVEGGCRVGNAEQRSVAPEEAAGNVGGVVVARWLQWVSR